MKVFPRLLNAAFSISYPAFRMVFKWHNTAELNGINLLPSASHWSSDFLFYFTVLRFLPINRLTFNGIESAKDNADWIKNFTEFLGCGGWGMVLILKCNQG